MRRPPAKRLNFSRIGVSFPFMPDLDFVLRLWCTPPAPSSAPTGSEPCVLRDRQCLLEVARLLAKPTTDSIVPPALTARSGAFLIVHLRMLDRGVPEERAMVCDPAESDTFGGPAIFEPLHRRAEPVRMVHRTLLMLLCPCA